jgi:hypothetical protein
MLASITPLGERGRQSTWGVTVIAFLLGAIAGGVAIGALAGGAGALALPSSTGIHGRLAAIAIAAAAAVALDAFRDPAPGPRRQVNERWMDQFRGWIYGAGYGAQLGLGVTTVVSSAATYVALIAAFLGRSVATGVLIGGCFGLVRGLTPLAAARVRVPGQLISFHAALDRWRPRAVRWGLVLLGAVSAAAVAGALT